MKQFLSLLIIVVIASSLMTVGFTFWQVHEQKLALEDDLERRTSLLADSFKESIRSSYINNTTSTAQAILDKFAGRERLLGIAIYDSKSNVFARSLDLSPELVENKKIPEKAMDVDDIASDFFVVGENDVYILATPLRQDGTVIGSLAVFQRANYINTAISDIWKTNIIRLFSQTLLFSLGVMLIVHLIIYRPVINMAEIIRQARSGKLSNNFELQKSSGFFNPITTEIIKITKSLALARNSASEEARMRLEKIDTPWTAERLKEFFKANFKERQIFVVSNREPYIHKKNKNKVDVVIPPSGMITALEPIMEACGGLWLAHGSGDADKQTVDSEDKIQVPPDEPKYTLKRIWLSEKEIKEYYVGFSNEALWPLCHLAHTRPVFRKQDWKTYRQVNGKFAQALLAEIKNVENPIILIQDYHFALLPQMIKKSRPDAQIGMFWHIPWPNTEFFSICPRRKEIVEGMLGADVLGFHIQQFCNNFLETVSKQVESIVDLEKFSVVHESHTTYIKPFPISVDFTNGTETVDKPKSKVLENLKLKTKFFGIGVDRLDYTKGILERLKGLEFFFHVHPEFLGQFTFLQVAPPTRENVEKYREFSEEVIQEVERINYRFQKDNWKPIIFLKEHQTREEVYALYREAHVCLVTSLSDGMNLVAKEYVTARDDDSGVLILSQFTGAARDLKSALIVNPYSAEETAEAIHQALTMPLSEQRIRMKKMRHAVKDYNIYRWAAEFLKAITNLG